MQNNENKQVFAGFFVRLAAYLIDWIIISAALLTVRIPFGIASMAGADFLKQDFIFRYSLYDIILYVLEVLYFILLTYYTGATLGKRLLHLQVVSAEDRKVTFFEIVFRETVGKYLSGLILFIGYFMIGIDKEKRGLHDILSDTRVVYSHKKSVTVPSPIEYHVHYGQPATFPNYQNQGNVPYNQPVNSGFNGGNQQATPVNPTFNQQNGAVNAPYQQSVNGAITSCQPSNAEASQNNGSEEQ